MYTYVQHECVRVLHHAQLDKLIGVTHFNVIIRTLFIRCTESDYN